MILEYPFVDAVRGFWNQRKAQRQAQELSHKVDVGHRSDVTGGKQMDGFALAITNTLLHSGVPMEWIHVKKSLTVVPGFFRPTKTLDFLVVADGILKVAIELKSHVGSSFGNNFNNRRGDGFGSRYLDCFSRRRFWKFHSALAWVSDGS